MSTYFNGSNFNRSGGTVSFGERAAQPSDFNSSSGKTYAAEYAASPTKFNEKYPNWQAYADSFVMRCPIVTMTGTQTCKTSSFLLSELKKYMEAGEVSVQDFKVPNILSGSTMPTGKYLNVGMSFTDNKNGYTEVTVSYTQSGKWELVQQEDSLPDPTKK